VMLDDGDLSPPTHATRPRAKSNKKPNKKMQ
jgi:hypothetical protein